MIYPALSTVADKCPLNRQVFLIEQNQHSNRLVVKFTIPNIVLFWEKYSFYWNYYTKMFVLFEFSLSLYSITTTIMINTNYLRGTFLYVILLVVFSIQAQQPCYNVSDGNDELYIFELSTGTISSTISVPADIEASTYSLNGDTIWLLNTEHLYYIDLNAGTPAAVEVLSNVGIDDDGLDGPFGDNIQFNDYDGMTTDSSGVLLAGNVDKSALGIVAISKTTGKVIPNYFNGDDYLPIFNHEDVRTDGMAVDPLTNELYIILNTGDGVLGSDSLYKIDMSSGARTYVGNFDIADVEGMAFSNIGQLYVVTGGASTTTSHHDKLWSVDLNSGEITEVRALSGTDNESCDCVKYDTSGINELSGYVYWDSDNSATFSGQDTGHIGYKVYLYRDVNNNQTYESSTDTIMDSLLTNKNGFYNFRIPYYGSASNYLVISNASDLPSGSVYTTDNIETASFTAYRQVRTNLNFGYNDGSNIICGTVFRDGNANAIYNPATESGTSFIKVYLYTDTNADGILTIGTDALIDSVLTSSDGYYQFNRTYTSGTDSFLITINTNDLPGADTLTTNTFQSAIFTSAGNLDADNDFGHVNSAGPIPNLISGYAYGDADQDAIFDGGEAALANVSIDLYRDFNRNGTIDANDLILDQKLTNGAGFYEFPVDYTSFTDSFTRIIDHSYNDAEQNGAAMTRSSDDLDLGAEKVGLRFKNINIPANANILEAYIIFTARDNGSGGTHQTTIRGELNATPFNFNSFDNNISNRTTTTASVLWNIPNFSAGNAYNTPDITALIQEIVDSTAWLSGGNLALILDDDAGGRSAKSRDHADGATEGPQLYIKYETSPSTVAYITKVDSTTGPSGSHLTTPETQTSLFSSGGNVDPNNNFGFYGGATPLPVSFLYINGTHVKPNNIIDWATASEIDNSHFEIEKATESGHFETIGTVEGNGNSNSIRKYQFIDQYVSGDVSHYRIKQIDYSGKYDYTPIITIFHKTEKDFSVYPNPAQNVLNISFNSALKSKRDVFVSIYGLDGQLIKEYEAPNRASTISIATNGLSNGLYYVKVSSEGINLSKRILIQH